MRRRNKFLIITACVISVLLVIGFNPIYAFRMYTPQSCTVVGLPTHFLVIRYATFENWTNSQPVAEGQYTICQSHPNDKAYACRATDCYGDNGTHILTGQRYTLYDGSYHDNTQWELKSNYIGLLVSDSITPTGQISVVFGLIVVAFILLITGLTIYRVWQANPFNADETTKENQHANQ